MLEVTNVSFTIEVRGVARSLLQNISFAVGSGDLCALMGSSGSGKSTLLDVVAGRKTAGFWSGSIRVSGNALPAGCTENSAYVIQDPLLVPTLTVEETIRYSVRTRLAASTDLEERVAQLLQMMQLTNVKDSRVGDTSTRGISGGQKKRLSIAVELVNFPSLLFLDEPTSGLDSSLAYEVVSAVRSVVTAERNCLCAIHQPSPEAFALFDKLVLLSEGRLIYHGPAAKAVEYFTRPELGYNFAESNNDAQRNPAEFVLDVSSGRVLASGHTIPRQPAELQALFRRSSWYVSTMDDRTAIVAAQDDRVSFVTGNGRKFASTQWVQLCVLVERTWVARMRDRRDLAAQALKSVTMGVILGLAFFGLGDVSGPFYEDGELQREAINVNSFLFFFMISAMISHGQSIPYICRADNLYRRELASGAYGPVPYWLSMLITIMPVQFASHVLLCALAYPLVDLNSNGTVFCYFLFATYVGTIIATISAMALAANVSSEAMALAIYPAQFLFYTPFSGYVVEYDNLPSYYKWVPPLCYPRWVFAGLMVNQWRQYSTDDEPGEENGNGDILGEYSFADFARADLLWIGLLFALFFAAVMLYGLLPPRNRLVKVADATDIAALTAPKDNEKVVVGVSHRRQHRTQADLRKSLLDNADNAALGEESLPSTPSEEPERKYEPILTVESLCLSSGTVAKAVGCKLVFQNVSYTVESAGVGAKVPLLVLREVSGKAHPGELVALMGASGAGKTTLLDILAQRKNTGTITGSVTYNESSALCSAAYVLQQDAHTGFLTVAESLTFAAALRLSEHVRPAAKSARVEKVLGIMGLLHIRDNRLGADGASGISGGQRKRLSIAVEILHLPDLLFLDEPTTGLDSTIALEVVSALRNLANQNRTVISTIHQPSPEAFALFDKLVLLAEGRLIYQGPAAKAAQFFEQSPFGFSRRPGANPADFVIAVAGGFLTAADGRSVTAGELAVHYSSFQGRRDEQAHTVNESTIAGREESITEVDETRHSVTSGESGEGTAMSVAHRTSLWNQTKVLLHRRVLVMSREPGMSASMIRDLLVGLLYGSVYYQLDTGGDCDRSCYFDRTSLLFYSVMLLVMGRMPIVSALFVDRPIFYRERSSGAYGTFAYFVSLVLPRLPLLALNVLCYSLGAYTMPDLRAGADHYFVFFVLMLLAGFCGLFFAYLVMALSPNTAVAMSYFPIVLLTNLLYAGYMVFLPTMADWQSSWLPYLSFCRYAFQGLVLNELQHNGDLPESHSYIQQLGFDTISVQGCVGALLLCVVLSAGALYLALAYVDFDER